MRRKEIRECDPWGCSYHRSSLRMKTRSPSGPCLDVTTGSVLLLLAVVVVVMGVGVGVAVVSAVAVG